MDTRRENQPSPDPEQKDGASNLFNDYLTSKELDSAECDELIIPVLPKYHPLKQKLARRHSFRLKAGETLTADHLKAAKFEKLAEGKDHIEEKKINTKTVYWGYGLFTSARLFFARGLSIAKSRSQSLKSNESLKKIFGILSLSYLIELLTDFTLIGKHIFSPDPNERHLAWYKRFKHAFFKDDRHFRMANALVWLPTNFISFILGGGLVFALINIAGFIFDVGLEGYRYLRDDSKLHHLLNKSKDKITSDIKIKLDNHIATKKTDATRKLYVAVGILTFFCINSFPPFTLVLLGSGVLLCGLATPIASHLALLKIILIMLGIAAIITALAFPPAALAVASLGAISTVTAALTFTIGSIIGGLGRRLWETFSSSPAKPEAIPTITTQNINEMKTTDTAIIQAQTTTLAPLIEEQTPDSAPPIQPLLSTTAKLQQQFEEKKEEDPINQSQTNSTFPPSSPRYQGLQLLFSTPTRIQTPSPISSDPDQDRMSPLSLSQQSQQSGEPWHSSLSNNAFSACSI